MYQKILVVLTGKESDHALLDHAAQLAAQLGAQVTILRVILIADDGGGGFGRQLQLEIGSSGWRRKNEAQSYLAHLADRINRRGLTVETALVIGSRSEGSEIVAYADAQGHDLIVMSSDSLPWYQRLLRRSQSDSVLRAATVAMLFVAKTSRPQPVTRPIPAQNRVMALLGNADL